MSSTSLTKDWRDGAGGPLGSSIKAYCEGVGGGWPSVGSGLDDGDLDDGVLFPFIPTSCPACNKNDPPYGGQSFPGGEPLASTPPGLADVRRYHSMLGPLPLMPGHRIRFVIAWDSCPGAALGTAPAPVATDIDLFLVRDNLVVAGSQTVKDVTEGFDITVPTAGSYSVWWAAPDGPGCSGNGHEPLGWAYAVWGP